MQKIQQQGIGVQRILKNFTKAIIEKLTILVFKCKLTCDLELLLSLLISYKKL